MKSGHDDAITVDDGLALQACEWLIRVRDTEPDPQEPIQKPEVRFAAFLAWMSQSPRHLKAVHAALASSRALHVIDPLRAIDVAGLIDRDNLAGCGVDGHLPSSLRGARPARSPWFICAAISVLLLLPLALLTTERSPRRDVTSIAQDTFMPLEDGSTVQLDTRAQVAVLFGPKSREVQLLAGEAIFDVRHDPTRPFRVISGTTVIEDVGTRFAAYRHSDGSTTVTVLDGEVAVSSAAVGTRALRSGQAATVGAHDAFRVENLSAPEIARRLSWRARVLSFEKETLAQAITEFNRYNVRQLVIADPSIAGEQLGGTFEAHDVDSFVTALACLFDIQAVSAPDNARVIELRRKPRSLQSPDPPPSSDGATSSAATCRATPSPYR